MDEVRPIELLQSSTSGVRVEVSAGFLPDLLEALVDVDCDYGSQPPAALRRLGHVLVAAVAADDGLAHSATGAVSAELANLLAFSARRWPLD
jgi:hypothetical protein